MLPRGDCGGQVVRVDCVARSPLLQLFERATEVLEDLRIDELDLPPGGHDGDQTRDRVQDEAQLAHARRRHADEYTARLAIFRERSRRIATAPARILCIATTCAWYAGCSPPCRGRSRDAGRS